MVAEAVRLNTFDLRREEEHKARNLVAPACRAASDDDEEKAKVGNEVPNGNLSIVGLY